MRAAFPALLLLLACQRTIEVIGAPPAWNCGLRCFRDENLDGLPGGVQQFFSAAPDPEPANRPELRYPRPGSVQPINAPEITFQWRSAGGNGRYYRIRLAPVDAPERRHEFYVPCRPPPQPLAYEECHYPMPARFWELAASELRGSTVSVVIDAADDEPHVVASSEPVTLSFTPAAIEAGIYYFSRGREVVRALLGSAAQPFVLPTNRFACVGCHAVSRDGRTVAYSYDRSFLGTARAEDPARALVAPADPPVSDAATVALNADGSLVAVSQQGRLSVRESATGKELSALEPSPAGGLYFPDWSPDGQELAATLAIRAEKPYAVDDGSIVAISWDGTRLGAPRMLVAGDAGQLHFHPAWSPDGAWIALLSAPLPGRGYDNRQARLRLVSRDGARTAELTAATAGQGAGWPRFAPVVHEGGSLMYLTFDSRLDYGYLLRNSRDPTGGLPQLWLTALDLRKLPGDPSSPPLWLPAQDYHLPSLLGTWTERLVCGDASPCPERSRCESGRCVRVEHF